MRGEEVAVPTIPLPENPSLENLKKQAKRLLKAARAGDSDALAQMREFHPRAAEKLLKLALSDAQLAVARAYGFASWTRLKQHIEVVDEYTWTPPPEQKDGALEDTFIRLACVDYEASPRGRIEQARRILAEHPEIARTGIYAAATAGDVSAARALLAANRDLANAKGGPLRWEPLLYACYSRLNSTDPAHSTLEVARLLLDARADPNAGFLWGGNVPPFTALTGAFGEGERDEPAHQYRDAIARLLLDAGADPNDGQTLYNRHFKQADDHLHLLFAYGLGHDKGGPWYKRLGDRMQSPARLLVEELWSAARKNYFARVKLLVEHGADVNTPGVRDGRTPYEAAIRAGNHDIAAYLLEHGAKKVELDVKERFAAACIAGRRAEALALLEKNPGLVSDLGHHRRVELLHRAVEGRKPEGIRLMADLGFEVSDTTRHDNVGMNLAATPLHNAAWMGDLEMVKLLMDLGADPTVRDPNYNGTPIGWAAHNNQHHVVDFMLPFANIFDVVRRGGVARVTQLLKEDPSLANAKDNAGYPVVFYLEPATNNLEEILELLRAHGGDINARDEKGRTVLDIVDAQMNPEFVETLRRYGARRAI